MRKLSLIVNPASAGGHAVDVLADVETELQRLGLEYRVEYTRSLEHAGELARSAAGADEVAVAFGGDGLIGAVAGALNGSDGVVGVLPGGRGNDFARTLGIPLEPVAACDVLANGSVRALDLGEADGRTFIGIASCGIDSDANRIANETRLVRGNLVYTYAALRALLGWRPATFELKLDGDRALTVTGCTIAAANSKAYGGGMMLAPNASLEDGLLDVVTIAQMPKLRLVRLLLTGRKGGHVGKPGVTIISAREVEISADRPFTMYADGDPIAELPVKLRSLEHAVRMIVPR